MKNYSPLKWVSLLVCMLLVMQSELKASTIELQTVTAGQLNKLITDTSIDSLRVSGSLNASDFTYIRNNLTNISYVDLLEVTISGNTLPGSAFSGKTTLKEVLLPTSLVNIESYAFQNCTQLEQVIIPEGLTQIGSSAFRGCAQLKQITLPEGLEQIRSDTFYDCTQLEQINLPENLKSIETYAFQNCTQLKQIILPEGLTSLGSSVFNGCTTLKSAFLPSTLKIIPTSTFRNCTALSEITFPEGLTQIGNEAFRYCYALKSVYFPSTLQSIGESAFRDNSSLSELTIQEGLQTIENYAFNNCTQLKGQLILPSTLTTIGSSVFSNTYYASCKINATTPPVAQSISLGSIKTVFVPENAAEAYKTESYWNTKLIIEGQPKAVTVTLPSPGTLGEKVLEQVSLFTEVNSLTISGTLNTTDFNLIKDMPNLITVDLSACTNKTLANQLFMGRDGLLEVKLPTNLTQVNSQCFYNCTALAFPELPVTLEELGNSTFSGCHNFYSVVLPENLKSIGSDAFASCYNLKNINLPQSIETIGNSTFIDCRSLLNIEIPENITAIPSSFLHRCSSLVSIKLPAGITSIGSSAFSGCSALANIQLPEKLTTIGSDAFASCTSLTSITFPSGVASIGNSAFVYCSKIKQVVCYQSIPPVLGSGNPPFQNTAVPTIELMVPFWAEAKYKLDTYWNKFNPITPINDEMTYIALNGSLSLSGDMRPAGMPTMDLKPASNLTVKGNLAFPTNDFILRHSFSYINNTSSTYSQILSECNAMTAQAVKMLLSAQSRWYYLSFPYDIAIRDIAIDDDAYFVFRRYDGATRAASGVGSSWKNMTLSDTLRAGTGYIFQCSKTVTNLTLPATGTSKNKLFTPTAITTSLEENTSATPSNAGWNLVGNPYATYYDIRCMDFTAPITYWNDNNNRYEAVSPIDDAFLLAPMRAFFVQKPEGIDAIKFNPEGRQTTTEIALRTAIRATTDRVLINLEVGNGELSDKSRIVLNPLARLSYETTCDAAKFMSTEPQVPQLYSLDAEQTRYAINERPLDNGTVNLGFYAGTADSYTFSLDKNLSKEIAAFIIDNVTGAKTDLQANDYTFSSEAGTFNTRFVLQLYDLRATTDTQSIQESAPIVYSEKNEIVIETQPGEEIAVYTPGGIKIAATAAATEQVRIAVVPGIYIVKIGKTVFKSVVY